MHLEFSSNRTDCLKARFLLMAEKVVPGAEAAA